MDSVLLAGIADKQRFAPGSRLGRYEIRSKIGEGGMGEVYLAQDTELDRPAALKFLLPEFASDEKLLHRFFREAKAVSALNHPNILTVYEIGRADNTHFFAAEFVEGVTLSQRLNSQMTFKQTLDVAIQIAAALVAAHDAGIVHRDMKPENVIIRSDGLVKVLDFGIAKLTGHAQLISADGVIPPKAETSPGMIIGTASYMSPEQARGKVVDARSDIFSFGVMLYEMAAGRKPFRGDNAADIIGSILHIQPTPLRQLLPTVPAALERIVDRTLRKERAQRYQTAKELLVDLQSLAKAKDIEAEFEHIPSANAEAEVPTRIFTALPDAVKRTLGQTNSIAVLPFLNLSADKENEYFSDGLAEEIINALTKVPELKVIARTSAFALRGRDQDLHTIGDRLGVGTILKGSVRRADSRIRVTAQLIRVADESHLWSETYDRELIDVFAIQDDISQAIAGALKVKFVSHQRGTVNVEAFQSYLKGLYWYQRYTPESLEKAREAFEQALRHDPLYAPAYAGLAVFYYGLGALSIKPMIAMAPLARFAAEKALTIDQSVTEAHSVLGLVAGAVEYDWQAAERHFQLAMAVDPVSPLVRVRYALYFLTPMGRFAEAFEQYQKALETDPLSMMVHFGLIFARYCQRHYAQAIKHALEALDLAPDYWLVHFALGLALSQEGSLSRAIESLETTVKLSPSFTLAGGFLAAEYVRCGRQEEAATLINEITERSRSHFVSPICFAIYEAALGQSDRMFEFLETTWTERDPYLTRMDAEPHFQRYRSDFRYNNLMERMKLG
ncbi:MAG TPA: protein kinase [Pyrinomonadaceae bacterium]|nr:protein kinase [Pyrinomonadaceae bacterium]